MRVLSSTRPYQALTIKDNKQNDLSDKTFTFLQRISSPFPFQKYLATGHNKEDVIQLDESSPPRIGSSCHPKPPQTLCLKAFTKNLPKAPAHHQLPLGSTCQDILVLFAPLLACRMAKGGGTSILVPFNLLLTSCIAFCPHAFDPSHSFCSSKLASESSQYLLFPSPVCRGNLSAHLSLSL